MTDNAGNGRIVGLLDALDKASARLRIEGDATEGPLSLRALFATALHALLQREQGGAAAARDRLEAFLRLLEDVAPGVVADAEGLASSGLCLADIEVAAERTFAAYEARLADARDALAPVQLQKLCEWEAEDLLRPLAASAEGGGAGVDTVDAGRLTGYLRRRFGDPALTVPSCQQLPGGFGKETYLFAVEGAALSGEFVLRRDMPVPLIPNACHRVAAEFAVIGAVGKAGFKTPHALWLDIDHSDIAGGDFIVMARSPGQAAGSLFGADSAPVPALNDTLGTAMAVLHRLPPLEELGDLTESIRLDLWNRPAHEAVRAYLENYLKMFRGAAHSYSPATAAIFRWLLQNLPESAIPSCLVHGDIGFHNMLVDAGELIAILDWEFAHIGHPAEDLAYVYNVAGKDLDWPRVIRAYEAAGGSTIPQRDFAYFRILMQARNAVSTNIASGKLFEGAVSDLRLLSGDFYFRPHILKALGAMIADFHAEFGCRP